MENPYFSDNSSSSYLTTKLRKFTLDLQKLLDKSDNESSALSNFGSVRSVGGTGPAMQSKLSNYHNNVNEPIEEVEDEEITDKKLISESIQKRRKASQHFDRGVLNFSKASKNFLEQSDTIHEEIEIEDELDDDLLSENNFYLSW